MKQEITGDTPLAVNIALIYRTEVFDNREVLALFNSNLGHVRVNLGRASHTTRHSRIRNDVNQLKLGECT